jgi:ADP-ribosylglycohydrolase
MKDLIRQAGDTDTNGAIVGGLIGSILGFKRLPKFYIKKLFKLKLD